jgi:hypothetical protein
MEKAFKVGDKVRCITASEFRGFMGKPGDIFTVKEAGKYEVFLVEDPFERSNAADRFELVEQQQHTITVRYPNGGQGVTLYFDTEQAAREYVRDSGQFDYSYELRAVPAPTVLRVTETTTIVRGVSEV